MIPSQEGKLNTPRRRENFTFYIENNMLRASPFEEGELDVFATIKDFLQVQLEECKNHTIFDPHLVENY